MNTQETTREGAALAVNAGRHKYDESFSNPHSTRNQSLEESIIDAVSDAFGAFMSERDRLWCEALLKAQTNLDEMKYMERVLARFNELRPDTAAAPLVAISIPPKPGVKPVWFDDVGENEVILTWYSESWQRDMPVTLCILGLGRFDLHAQSGDGHDEAVHAARELLLQRGIAVDPQWEMEGPTGLYYRALPLLVLP